MRPVNLSLKLTTADANGICAAQTTAGAADLTINGALYKASTIAYLGADAAIRITSAADDTGITFTVYGTNAFGVYSETVTGASGSYVDTVSTFRTVTNIIASGATAGNVSAGTSGDVDSLATAATLSAGGGLNRSGIAYRAARMYGTATLVPAQVVYLVSAGNLSAIIFTVYGRDANGDEASETITGPNATTTSGTTLFAEVIGVSASAAVGTAVTVGVLGDTDYICESQTTAGAEYLVFNGTGCDTTPRHLSIYSAGDESDITFTVRGLDRYGLYMTEAITGPNATTVKGSKNFSVVHTVRASAAVGNNVTVGSADEADSHIVLIDNYATRATYQVVRSSDASFENRVGYVVEPINHNGKDENNANYLYPYSGWLSVDEANAITGPISALRLRVRTFVRGTITMSVLCPLER